MGVVCDSKENEGVYKSIMKKERLWMIIAGIIGVLTVAGIAVWNMNESVLTFNIMDGEIIRLEYGETELPKVTAVYTETLFQKKGIEVGVTEKGKIDFDRPGTYEMIYTAEYKNAQESIQITVVIEDKTAPVIILEGGETVALRAGEKYEELGFTAIDNLDGDITEDVNVSGEVRVNGISTLVYEVKDSSGNVSKVERTVTVEVEKDQKVIYLTFDDGPSAYTRELLDVLDRYGVKATFFVTGQNPDYLDMIGEAYRRGHTIALHTYSHDYAIYSSEESYYEDLQKIQDIVVEQTGVEAKIIRFPGGTSNTASRKYCEGIMSVLAEGVVEKGYTYCDWNVSSGDGGGAFDETTVIHNVTANLTGIRKAIVLQHDTQRFSVDAVDDIIRYGENHGYIFLPLTENMDMVQQRTLN